MWSPAYTGFLSSGALREVGVGDGNQTEGDSWGALEISQVRVLPGKRARGRGD